MRKTSYNQTSKYFRNPQTAEELRKQYIQLLKKYHPDNGGSEEAMKEINNEYEILFERLKNIHEASQKHAGAEETKEERNQRRQYSDKLDKALKEVLQKIITLDGISIELCGSWLYLSGNTYPYKDIIKEAGFRWSKSKKRWYWTEGMDDDDFNKNRYRGKSMSYIRLKHGSEFIDTEKKACLEG